MPCRDVSCLVSCRVVSGRVSDVPCFVSGVVGSRRTPAEVNASIMGNVDHSRLTRRKALTKFKKFLGRVGCLLHEYDNDYRQKDSRVGPTVVLARGVCTVRPENYMVDAVTAVKCGRL